MRVLIVAKYNGQYYGMNQSDKGTAEAVARELFGEYEDGKLVEPTPGVTFDLFDTIRHNWGTRVDNSGATIPTVDDSQLSFAEPTVRGFGWVVIVRDQTSYENVIKKIGYPHSLFCQMYNIDVIHLNEDATTQDAYAHMTPSHWM